MSGSTISDIDTHVTETPDVWTSRVPDTLQDRLAHGPGRQRSPRVHHARHQPQPHPIQQPEYLIPNRRTATRSGTAFMCWL